MTPITTRSTTNTVGGGRGRVSNGPGGRSPGNSGDPPSRPDIVVPRPPDDSCDDKVADVGAKFRLVPGEDDEVSAVQRGRVVGGRGGKIPGDAGARPSRPDSVVPRPPGDWCDDEVADVGAKFLFTQRQDEKATAVERRRVVGCRGGKGPGDSGARPSYPNSVVPRPLGDSCDDEVANVRAKFRLVRRGHVTVIAERVPRRGCRGRPCRRWRVRRRR